MATGGGGSVREDGTVDAKARRDLLPALERINRIILSAPSLESVLAQALDEMLPLFGCQRAWLLHPCDPAADHFGVPMERTHPDWPGAGAVRARLPLTPFVKRAFSDALQRQGACRWDRINEPLPEDELVERYSIRAMMFLAIRPRAGLPWLLGVHHCTSAHVYDENDASLLEAIGARLADGLTGLLAYQASISDQRRLEQAQRIAQVGSYEWRRDADTYWSQELYRLLGLSPGERPERFETVIECIHPDDRARARQIIFDVMRYGGSYDFQVRALRHGDEWIMQARGQATLGPDDQVTHMMGVAQDVTERVRAEEHRLRLEAQLRQSQKMQSLGQLTGGVAHDFNNLLTVILGNLEEIDHAEGELSAEVKCLLGDVSAAANRAAELTQMLTAFSRRQPLEPRIVDVNRLLGSFESLLARTLGETIGIEVIRGAGLWPCEVDPTQLESALLNLALNSRDAMPGGGKLTIETANARVSREYADEHDEVSAGQYVQLAVTDSGIGMSAETLSRAFEPFFTTKGAGRGTGLGLSMVYGFVKQSGGHIKLYSEPGEGTTAKIYLPRTKRQEPVAEDGSDGSEVPLGNGELVLVVEDEPSVRALTVRMVERLGYAVLVAEDGPSALELFRARPDVALLFTDVVLPGGMNGAELARAAQQLRSELPVLFTSGYTENAIIHHGRLDPDVTLLEKPFTRAALARRLRDALERAR